MIEIIDWLANHSVENGLIQWIIGFSAGIIIGKTMIDIEYLKKLTRFDEVNEENKKLKESIKIIECSEK